MTTIQTGEESKDVVLPAVDNSVDIEGAKNRQTGLHSGEKFAYLTVNAWRAVGGLDVHNDSYKTTAKKILQYVLVVLATIVSSPIGIIAQPAIGIYKHQKQVSLAKPFTDPILNTLNEAPLTPANRHRIKDETGLNVAFAVKTVKEHDELLMSFDRDPVAEQVEKQADRIVAKLKKIPAEKQAAALKEIVEAVVNRTNHQTHLNVDRRAEVAQQLYDSVTSKFVVSEATDHVEAFVSKPEVTEFARDFDALSAQTAEILNVELPEARRIVHEAVHDAIVVVEEEKEVSLKELATQTPEADATHDANRNQFEERITKLNEQFALLLDERAELQDLSEDYKRNKTVAEMRQILKTEIASINKERTKLQKTLNRAEKKLKKDLEKASSQADKEELRAANNAKVTEYTQNLSILSAKEEILISQMNELDEHNQVSETPYDQRLLEINVEVAQVYSQLKINYTALENYDRDIAIRTEAFDRVLALINSGAEGIDYTKSLQEISDEFALEIVQLSASDDEEGQKALAAVELSSYDTFNTFYSNVNASSLAARAATKLFMDSLADEQKNNVAQLVASEIGYEKDLVENGHAYLIAYIEGADVSDDVEVYPYMIREVLTSEAAKVAATAVVEVEEETVEEPSDVKSDTGVLSFLKSHIGVPSFLRA